jgi:putative ABC transport system substrate-binding protein
VMNRRTFIVTAAGVLAASLSAEAQQPGKVWRVGMLLAGERPSQVEALREGLRELGYNDGQNVVIEVRHADGRFERLPAAAGELVNRKIDVIVATGSEGVQAARTATHTIPIVMTYVGDPVSRGFVASRARPGGNVTGVANLADELDIKRLELLKEVVPKIARIAVLFNPPQPAHATQLRNLEVAAQSLSVRLQPVAVRGSADFDGAFSTILRERAGGVTMLGSLLHSGSLAQIAELALKGKVPAISYNLKLPTVGGLMAYASTEEDTYRRAALYVARILRGAKPADLPVEQPTKFELVINLKTAKALGLTIPPYTPVRPES